jgi:hypothetical protein
MFSQPSQTREPPAAPDLQVAALNRLRLGRNPFAMQVTTVGTAEESIRTGVPEYTANQFADLLDIICTYREDRSETRVYPLLGDRGAGKTHLLYTLRAELQKRARQSGEETMLVVVDRLSAGMDPIDYLLWQIVNHLLAQQGEGERMLRVIAGRLTARLLAEALRRLAPHQRAGLIPPKGFWDGLRLRMGSSARVQGRLDGIEGIIGTCDGKNPTLEELHKACEAANLPFAAAVGVIKNHLEQTESINVLGWLRQQLYRSLAQFALLGDREPFKDLHEADFEEAPPNVKNAGDLSRQFLKVWIELLGVLKIPVVVIFDQLEDYLRSAAPEQEKINSKYFTGATALFINELRHVCILVFAEQGLWTELMNEAEAFAAERLRQPFALPGRPARPYIVMPARVPQDIITRLIAQRIRIGFPDLDLTGLPPTFPFTEGDINALKEERSIRGCLRRLANRYDEIVHKEVEKKDLRKTLDDLWKERVADAADEYGTNMDFRVAFIPEVQNAIQGWLECLAENGLTGSGPWHKVEMLTDPNKQLYGNLSVIRTTGLHAPGVGIAAWLGRGRAQPYDLKQRLGFFDANPCPIRTLIMLRADGEDVLVGETEAVYNRARRRHDVRIHQYEPRHLHALMGFTPWLQAARPEIEATKESDPRAETTFHDFLGGLSKELLGWIDVWRKPVVTTKEAVV